MPDNHTATEPRSAVDIEAELNSIRDPIEPAEPSLPGSPEATEASAVVEATRKGWVPRDAYTGDPAKWVDATTFNKRGALFVTSLQREVSALKRQIDSFEGTKAAFVKFSEERLAAKDAEYKSTIAALRVQHSQAVREGEDELAVSLEDKIDLLKEQRKEVAAVAQQPPAPASPNLSDPVLAEWIEDGNAWFRDDPKLSEYAIAIGNELVAGGERVRGRKFLDLVRSRMEEEFPRKFGVKKAPAVSGGRDDPVGAGSSRSSTAPGSGRTEADLPQVDRDLMRQFIREGWTTKEKFLSGYFSK